MEATPPERTDSVEFSRIVSFTDGVFAIAITLLVLNFDVPETPGADIARIDHWIETLGGDMFAYFLTFAVLGRLWLVHHRLFGMLERFDSRLMVLNLVYLSMIVLIPFPAELIGDYGEERVPVMVYATVLAAAAGLNWLMARHAASTGLVRPEHREATASWGGREFAFIPVLFVLSIPVALVSPLAAQLMWAVLIIARIARGWLDRRAAR